MIYNILAVYPAMKIVIETSNHKAFKSRKLLLMSIEIKYLEDVKAIFEIFVKATFKL